LGWLHITSDLAIWLAYLAIPVVLALFVRRRRDVPFPRVFWLFGLFILSCGTTHLIEAVIFYEPVYRLAGVVKLVTAVVSWATAAPTCSGSRSGRCSTNWSARRWRHTTAGPWPSGRRSRSSRSRRSLGGGWTSACSRPATGWPRSCSTSTTASWRQRNCGRAR